MSTFSNAVQVLFLVSLCLTTFCHAHRALSEEPTTTSAAGEAVGEQLQNETTAGETKNAASNINAFGATRCCGCCHQPPHWVYPPPECGGGGCYGGGGGCCGGSSTDVGGGVGCCRPSCSGGCCGGSGGSSTGLDCGDSGGYDSNGGCGCYHHCCSPPPINWPPSCLPPPINCMPTPYCNGPKPTKGLDHKDQIKPINSEPKHEKQNSEPKPINNGN